MLKFTCKRLLVVREMTTIKDVARLADVSVATVSRVLNNSGYVRQDTRKKVEATINQLDYKPNEVARSLYKKKSKLVGLLLPDIRNPFFPELARGVEDELQKEGYHLIVGNADEDMEKELKYMETFKQNNVVGIITAVGRLSKECYQECNCPIVFSDRTLEGYPSVRSDVFQGGRLAALELIKRGSRSITVLKGPSNLQTAQDRFKGTIDGLCHHEVGFQVIETESFGFKDVQKVAIELFDKYPLTDGVIACNDVLASAVLSETLKRNRRVPEDVQIIGFDDIPMSKLLYPPLSTIRQSAYVLGNESVKMLFKVIENKLNIEEVIIPVEFVKRETTRKE